MLSARNHILAMKPYYPPVSGRDGLLLDFNENTAGCSMRVLAALRSLAPEMLAKYPERQSAEAEVARFSVVDNSLRAPSYGEFALN